MPDSVPRNRVLFTALLLVGAMALLHAAARQEQVPPRRPLTELPLQVAGYTGRDLPIEARLLTAAGVDEYVNRVYEAPDRDVALYIGYYKSQRTGDTIHSPKNCLPGSGWEPLRAGRASIPLAGRAPISVNEYLVEKGRNRVLVLYWYQAHGRAEASEYSAKFWLVVNAIQHNRSNGALVRVMTDLRGGEEAARARVVGFAQGLYPLLNDFIPE